MFKVVCRPSCWCSSHSVALPVIVAQYGGCKCKMVNLQVKLSSTHWIQNSASPNHAVPTTFKPFISGNRHLATLKTDNDYYVIFFLKPKGQAIQIRWAVLWLWLSFKKISIPFSTYFMHNSSDRPLFQQKTSGFALLHFVPEINGPKIGLICYPNQQKWPFEAFCFNFLRDFWSNWPL